MYIKYIPVKSNEKEEDIDQRFEAKDSQWLGISRIRIETIKSEFGLSLLVSERIVLGSVADIETHIKNHSGRG